MHLKKEDKDQCNWLSKSQVTGVNIVRFSVDEQENSKATENEESEYLVLNRMIIFRIVLGFKIICPSF